MRIACKEINQWDGFPINYITPRTLGKFPKQLFSCPKIGTVSQTLGRLPNQLFFSPNIGSVSPTNIYRAKCWCVRPLRIAFDDMDILPHYEKAIRMSTAAGMRDFSNYLLYNYKDKPIDLYRRLKINIDLCEELKISIYSFPMKYHPIIKQAGDTIDYSHNRDFIGEHWNRKYIRAVQAILNSTKGKIGRGESFFSEAFGHNEEEFYELLVMPETFILYRYFFKWLKDKHPHSTDNWRQCYNDCMQTLDETEKAKIRTVIHYNDFSETVQCQFTNPKSRQLIEFYTNYRNAIVKEGTDLYKLKQEYDKDPTIALRRKRN